MKMMHSSEAAKMTRQVVDNERKWLEEKVIEEVLNGIKDKISRGQFSYFTDRTILPEKFIDELIEEEYHVLRDRNNYYTIKWG